MERALIWFKCAAAHDPVRPVVRQQAQIGWKAKERKVELTIDYTLSGEELLKRMRGWFTADVNKAVEVFRQYGRLKVLDDVDLVIETENESDMVALSDNLTQQFDKDVWVEIIKREKLP
jgi:hypothetical protein